MTPEQRDVLNRIAARDNDWTDPTNAIRACLAELDAANAELARLRAEVADNVEILAAEKGAKGVYAQFLAMAEDIKSIKSQALQEELDAAKARIEFFENDRQQRAGHVAYLQSEIKSRDAEIAHMQKVAHQLHSTDTSPRTLIGYRVVRENTKGEREYVHSLGGWGPIGHASHFYGLGHADEANKDAQQRGGRLVPVYLRVVKR